MCDTQTPVLIDGELIPVDSCIATLVEGLRWVGTISSCCGHGKGPGYVTLKDGRQLFIMPAIIPWRRVSWRDIWHQFKASIYEALWNFGILKEFQVSYDLAWPRRLVGVRK